MTHDARRHETDARREAQEEATARGLPITLWLDRIGWATTPWRPGDSRLPGFVAIYFPEDPLPQLTTEYIVVSPRDHVGRTSPTPEITTMATTTHTTDSTRIYTLTQQQAETIAAVLQDAVEGMGDYDETCMAEIQDALSAFVAPPETTPVYRNHDERLGDCVLFTLAEMRQCYRANGWGNGMTDEQVDAAVLAHDIEYVGNWTAAQIASETD